MRGIILGAGVACLATACGKGGGAPPAVAANTRVHPELPGADPERGRHAAMAFGCGACHDIDGVPGARGRVGPPLDGIGSRRLLAGEIANTPENLVYWIVMPQSIEPGSGMPNLGVTDGQARDIAAYLYTLK